MNDLVGIEGISPEMAEAVSSACSAIFESAPEKSVYDRLVDLVSALRPFGSGLLRENCADNLWSVTEPCGGMSMRRAMRPIRFMHYTYTPEALESILVSGIRQNVCRETGRNDVWANVFSEDLIRDKLAVVFDVPAGTEFSVENNTQAVFFRTVPKEWFVSANTAIGENGMDVFTTRILDFMSDMAKGRSGSLVETFERPELQKVWSLISRESLDKLLKLYDGIG